MAKIATESALTKFRALAEKLLKYGSGSGVTCGCKTMEQVDAGDFLCMFHDDESECCELCEILNEFAELLEETE